MCKEIFYFFLLGQQNAYHLDVINYLEQSGVTCTVVRVTQPVRMRPDTRTHAMSVESEHSQNYMRQLCSTIFIFALLLLCPVKVYI